ncbi:hypothetical protein ACFPM0_01760 [Pseudonocardia sulfidoxydans]|uniref:hypothetical protein n=1 Tax=Pseudonocardia sulfidoxydans TaxID=54011 RepID=UPI003621CEB0
MPSRPPPRSARRDRRPRRRRHRTVDPIIAPAKHMFERHAGASRRIVGGRW